MRRGRPPKVEIDGRFYRLKVKGKDFAFKNGGDGRLRALGSPARDEDFEHAREVVAKAIASETKEA